MSMEFLKAAGGILATIAPTVASAMGGPFAGMATTALIDALGLAPEASKDEVLQAISVATPEQLLKIKEVEAKLLIDLKTLDVDLKRLSADNTKNAREREIATKDWTPRVLAGLIIGMYMIVQFYLMWYVLDTKQLNIVMRSLGTLDAAVGLVLGYYFGSSVGSANKTEQLTTIINDKI